MKDRKSENYQKMVVFVKKRYAVLMTKIRPYEVRKLNMIIIVFTIIV